MDVSSLDTKLYVYTLMVVHEAYTMQDKGWHGHRLAYTRRCEHTSSNDLFHQLVTFKHIKIIVIHFTCVSCC